MIKATINFKLIHSNIKKLRETLLPNVKICAVVKANAYSLGDVVISREIESKVDCFAVACIKEAIRLRLGKIKKPILLFGVCEDFEAALLHNLTISINSVSEMSDLAMYLEKAKATRKCKVHIKVNTGMNRYGIANVWQLKEIIKVASSCPQIQIDGLYTQFAHAIDDMVAIEEQLKRFTPFRSIIKSHFPHAIIHAACSNNSSYVPAQFDMVRVGKLMYGGYDGYKTAVKVTSHITAIQQLQKGAKVGYNGTDGVTRATTCAVVPCGYADLVHYRYSNTHQVLVDGQLCRVLGRVCMDTIIIDVTGIRNPLGKRVTIIDEQSGLTLMEIARNTKTIVCNMLCSFKFDRCEITYKK